MYYLDQYIDYVFKVTSRTIITFDIMYYSEHIIASVICGFGMLYANDIADLCISAGTIVKHSVKRTYNTYKLMKTCSTIASKTGFQVSKHKVAWQLIKSLWLIGVYQIMQSVNKSVVRLDDDTYEVRFCIRDRLYKMIVHPSSCPDNILQIVDDAGDDVTYDVKPYMGPKCNWYGSEPPYDELGSQTFSIIDIDGEETVIGRNDELINEIHNIGLCLSDSLEEIEPQRRIDEETE